MVGILQLDIDSNKGLGPFQLLDTMYQTMTKLKAEKLDAEVTFVSGPLISKIQLKRYNINLVYESKMQKLVLIEVNLGTDGKPSAPDLFTFKGDCVTKFEFKTIYNKIFGPTYPGRLDSSSNYMLSYNGICFKFPSIGKAISLDCEASKNYDDLLIQNLSISKKEIVCNTFFIYNSAGLPWSESILHLNKLIELTHIEQKLKEFYKLAPALAPLRKTESFDSHTKFTKYIGNQDNNYVKALESKGGCLLKTPVTEINLARVNIRRHKINFEFSRHPSNCKSFTIKLGKTTQQQIFEHFGPPEDYIFKKKHQKKEIALKCDSQNLPKASVESTPSTFTNFESVLNLKEYTVNIHNYFSFGIDIIYEERSNEQIDSNVASKVIIHNNEIESMEFMRYERCNIIFVPEKDDQIECYNSMFWDSIASDLKLDINNKRIFLNRKEYEMNDYFSKTDNDFEFVEWDGAEASEVTENEDLNKWALSKLYASDGAIFEILIESEKLSSVILF